MKESGETGVEARNAGLDIPAIRADFPVLQRQVHGKPLAYLDNAATAQMPRPVIDAYSDYHSRTHSNVHRGVHQLSQQATDEYEGTRETLRRFLNAEDPNEIIFTYGTTDALNLVAQCYGRPYIGEGDEVLITHMEHHSNIVPWKRLCDECGARLKVVPVTDSGELDYDAFVDMLSERTRLLGVLHVSNALGTVNPVREMTREAHRRGIPVLVDGAQAVPHMPVDVQDIGCDFYAFSAHKMCGPTGIGALYARRNHLEAMPPYRGGGDMILSVSFEEIVYNHVPHKFEAGTPGISQVIGMGKAAGYLMDLGMDRLHAYESELLDYAHQQVSAVEGVRIFGTAPQKASVLSFNIEGVHPHDTGTILDHEGIAIRTGHHCAQPLMDRYGVPAMSRASFAFYNTREEVDRLVDGIQKVKQVFA